MFVRQLTDCIADRRMMAALWLTAAFVTAAAIPDAPAGPPTYSARLLTVDISAIGAAAMNEDADVVGTTSSGGPRAWVSIGGASAALLPLPIGAQYSWASDINDWGMIVGVAGPNSAPEFGGMAVAWTPDGSGGYSVDELGALPGHVASYATAVNNLGESVGYSSNGTYRYPVLFTAGGGIQDLSATGVFDPADINDQRVLVDHSFTSKLLDLDTMEVVDLGVPAGPPSYLATTGAAINETGQVAGVAIYACCENCDRVAARYTDGIGWEVLSGCGQGNGATSINDLGDVVMRLNVAPYVRFEGIGSNRIEDLIDSDAGHWYLFNRSGPINNARQIAVAGTNSVTGESGVILLTPIGAGDLDGDGDVDLADLSQLLTAFGSCEGDASFDAAADIDSDGCVGLADLSALLTGYGAGA